MNEQFMREAIRLSGQKMRCLGGGPFGAVVVRDDRIIGRGWNQVTGKNDPTAHAEIMAIRMACRRLKSFRLTNCEIYTSCEPCPMCLAAIYWARIKKIYFANTRADAARIGFDDAVIGRELARPLKKRRIPAQQLLRKEAGGVFEEWVNLPGKLQY